MRVSEEKKKRGGCRDNIFILKDSWDSFTRILKKVTLPQSIRLLYIYFFVVSISQISFRFIVVHVFKSGCKDNFDTTINSLFPNIHLHSYPYSPVR